MNETFTNVAGEQELLAAIVRCWASVWGQRVIAIDATGQTFDFVRISSAGRLGLSIRQVSDSPRDDAEVSRMGLDCIPLT
jgi:hypothetical protein